MRVLFVAALGLLLPPIFTMEAHAYLDGGTSAMLVQLLFGGAAGALAFIKFYGYKWFGWGKKSSEEESDKSNGDQDG